MTKNRDLNKLLKYFDRLTQLKKLAKSYGIEDILVFNNLRTLQALVVTNMKALGGITGNDAIDSLGREWEVKTVDANRRYKYITLSYSYSSEETVTRLRNSLFLIALFDGDKMLEVYAMHPDTINRYSSCKKLALSAVKNFGYCLYSVEHGVSGIDTTIFWESVDKDNTTY